MKNRILFRINVAYCSVVSVPETIRGRIRLRRPNSVIIQHLYFVDFWGIRCVNNSKFIFRGFVWVPVVLTQGRTSLVNAHHKRDVPVRWVFPIITKIA